MEFESHEHALVCLRQMNNNPALFGGRSKRPIVEFAVESVKALKIQEKKRKAVTEMQQKRALAEGVLHFSPCSCAAVFSLCFGSLSGCSGVACAMNMYCHLCIVLWLWAPSPSARSLCVCAVTPEEEAAQGTKKGRKRRKKSDGANDGAPPAKKVDVSDSVPGGVAPSHLILAVTLKYCSL